MSNCRNTVLAVGPEHDVSRFVAFAFTETGEEETTFTEQFETGVLLRGFRKTTLGISSMSGETPSHGPLRVRATLELSAPETAECPLPIQAPSNRPNSQ